MQRKPLLSCREDNQVQEALALNQRMQLVSPVNVEIDNAVSKAIALIQRMQLFDIYCNVL